MAIDIKQELAAVEETKRAALDAARPEAVAKQHVFYWRFCCFVLACLLGYNVV